MSYQTILVHADTSPHAEGRIQLAANLAQAFGAHLVGSAMTGVSRFVYPDPSMPVAVDLIGRQVEVMQERAGQALELFDTLARRTGVETYERRMVNDEPDTGLAMQARYADLVVVSQADRDEPSSTAVSGLPDFVVLGSPRPVLVVPYAQPPMDIQRHALVGWNGSAEAARAIGGAIPLLRRVREVTLVVFNADSHYGLHGEQPGADAAMWLARHGLRLNVMVQNTSIDIGDALLSMAADLNADLLVMGAYGRPRFRELLMGGTTRTVLATMTVPVLLSH